MIGSIPAIVLGALVAEGASLEVRSKTICPSEGEVGRALAGLQPPDGAAVKGAVVVAAVEDRLDLELVGEAGDRLAARSLPAEGTCAERARAVAIVVAAWMSDLAAGAPEQPLALPPPPLPALTTSGLAAAAIPPPRPAARARWRDFGLEGGWLASANSQTIASGGRAAVIWKIDRASRLRLGVTLTGERQQTLRSTDAAWSRRAVTLGLGHEAIRRGPLFVAANLDAVAAQLRVSNRSLPGEQTRSRFDPGAQLGLRAGVRAAAPLTVWLEAAVALWPRPQTVPGADRTTARELPGLEALLSVGFGLEADDAPERSARAASAEEPPRLAQRCPSLAGRFWRTPPQCTDRVAETFARAVAEVGRRAWDPDRVLDRLDPSVRKTRGRALTTVLRVRLDSFGKVVAVDLDESSGIDVLDAEALASIAPGSTMPYPPACVAHDQRFEFRLWLCVET